MNFDILFENIHIGGPGAENYRNTVNAFRTVTGEVIEEITLVEPLSEIDPEMGVAKTIARLNDQYPGVSSFILDRVVERVKGKRRHPVYEVIAEYDEVDKSA